MINSEIARAFERIADLMEIDGADRFRINAYRRAARTISDQPGDIAELASQDSLTDLPGIGKGTAQRIQQYIQTGHIDVLDELQEKLPNGLPALLEIPGMGPKKVSLVYQELNVQGIEDLKKAIDSDTLASLPGLGETSAKKIAEGIAFLKSRGDRTPLGIALPIAQMFAERIAGFSGVKQVEIAGSLRRGQETIGDIDILCESANGKQIIQAFTKLEGVKRILASGDTKGSVTVEIDQQKELQIDLRVVSKKSVGAALQYFTGSKEHNVRLREAAIKKKWRLNEYGLYDGEKQIAGAKEKDIYTKLGYRWVPPEMREDRGELESDIDFDELVTVDDIRGDLHMHTVASDGKNSIAEMALAAKSMGYQYIAICDHSKSSTIANGLTVQRMKKHIFHIRKANEKINGITILVGCECDIMPDGSMDYPDDILAQCDWVVASIHSAMGSTKSSKKLNATERTLAAMENPYVSAIGHPTGRLINRRAPMKMDIQEVIDIAQKTQTFLEINASWHRLDLKDTHIRLAIEAGVPLTINTDAHSTHGLEQIVYGVLTARRGGATRKNIVNTWTLNTLRKKIENQRN